MGSAISEFCCDETPDIFDILGQQIVEAEAKLAAMQEKKEAWLLPATKVAERQKQITERRVKWENLIISNLQCIATVINSCAINTARVRFTKIYSAPVLVAIRAALEEKGYQQIRFYKVCDGIKKRETLEILVSIPGGEAPVEVVMSAGVELLPYPNTVTPA